MEGVRPGNPAGERKAVTEVDLFRGKVGLQQRVLPAYRAAFFDRLAQVCSGGLSVFAGEPRDTEAISTAGALRVAHRVQARNLDLFGGPVYACLQWGLLRWLREWDPDVLILEASARNLLNGLAVAWMHRRGRPVIGWGLGAPPVGGWLAGLRQARRRSYLRRFDGLIAYSSRGAQSYREEGITPDRVFVAVNAVSGPPTPLSRPTPPPDRARRVLFVGRLQTRKRVDALLAACDGLEPAPEVWIVGEGPARAALERLAQRGRLSVRFLGGVHGAALEQVYREADLFVLPGTGGLAVQEAMAHGLPVIVAEGDGTQADLVRPENGWLIPSEDAAALRQALRTALADPAGLRHKGEASHRIVAQEANIEVMAGEFVRALNQTRAAGG